MPQRKPRITNPLAKRPFLKKKLTTQKSTRQRAAREWVPHILTLAPATGFMYRFESSTGSARELRLERGALEEGIGPSATVGSFRAGVFPAEAATQGGFYTSPDSIPMTAWAMFVINNAVPGDFIICRSLGSFDGLKVTLKLYREDESGSLGLIFQTDIQDADEHRFEIP